MTKVYKNIDVFWWKLKIKDSQNQYFFYRTREIFVWICFMTNIFVWTKGVENKVQQNEINDLKLVKFLDHCTNKFKI